MHLSILCLCSCFCDARNENNRCNNVRVHTGVLLVVRAFLALLIRRALVLGFLGVGGVALVAGLVGRGTADV